MTTTKYCLECKEICKKLYVCGNCKKATYCGSNCQRNNWNKEHSTKCIEASAILNLFNNNPKDNLNNNSLWDVLINDIIDIDNPVTFIKDLTDIMVDKDPKILMNSDEIERLHEKRISFLKWLFDFDAEDKPKSYKQLFSDYSVRLSFARNLLKTICGTQRMEGYEFPIHLLDDVLYTLYKPYMNTVAAIKFKTPPPKDYTDRIYKKETLYIFTLCFLNACQAGNVDIIQNLYEIANELFSVYEDFKWNYPENSGFEVALKNNQIQVLYYLYDNKRQDLERKIKSNSIVKTSGDSAFLLCVDQHSENAEFLFFLAQYANVSAKVLKSALELFTKTNNESAALKIFYWLESIKAKEKNAADKSFKSLLELQTILNVISNDNDKMMEIFLNFYAKYSREKYSYELSGEDKSHFFRAFVYAVEKNQQKFVKLILKYMRITDDNYLQEAIWKAINNDHTRISQELLQDNKYYIKIDLDLFMVALKNKNEAIVKSILLHNMHFKENILNTTQLKLYYIDKYMPELSKWVRNIFL